MWVNCDLDVLNSTIIIAQMCIHQYHKKFLKTYRKPPDLYAVYGPWRRNKEILPLLTGVDSEKREKHREPKA